MNSELYLIYINNLGVDFNGNNRLEFIFSNHDKKKDIDGEDWNAIPASSRPLPPFQKFIKKIGILETEVDFEFIQDNTCFSVWDAVDGVIAIAYESLDNYENYPDNRLIFHFGTPKSEVEAKLYERDLTLAYTK